MAGLTGQTGNGGKVAQRDGRFTAEERPWPQIGTRAGFRNWCGATPKAINRSGPARPRSGE